MQLKPLQLITKFFELFNEQNEAEVNYYKQRGMSEDEAQTMTRDKKLPKKEDAFDNNYDAQSDELNYKN